MALVIAMMRQPLGKGSMKAPPLRELRGLHCSMSLQFSGDDKLKPFIDDVGDFDVADSLGRFL